MPGTSRVMQEAGFFEKRTDIGGRVFAESLSVANR